MLKIFHIILHLFYCFHKRNVDIQMFQHFQEFTELLVLLLLLKSLWETYWVPKLLCCHRLCLLLLCWSTLVSYCWYCHFFFNRHWIMSFCSCCSLTTFTSILENRLLWLLFNLSFLLGWNMFHYSFWHTNINIKTFSRP